MNLSKSLITHLGTIAESPAQLVSMLLECADITTEIAQARKQHDCAKAKYDSEVAMLSNVIGNLQEKCPHYQITRHNDPVDSSDSYDQCEVCQKHARRLTTRKK